MLNDDSSKTLSDNENNVQTSYSLNNIEVNDHIPVKFEMRNQYNIMSRSFRNHKTKPTSI